jgi:hypothetical protein
MTYRTPDYAAQEAEEFVRAQLDRTDHGIGNQLIEGFRLWRPMMNPQL